MQMEKVMTMERQTTLCVPGNRHSSGPVEGQPLSIDGGFEALSFRHNLFGGSMDPLVMVDHYTMTQPTFGAHPHAGMSAVSVLFEDSVGRFNNRDSLGNDIDLEPGDLYWLKAGSGAVHDEKPLPGAKIHGLQMFVNLPASMRQDAPESLHVKALDMPRIESNGAQVRVVLGESNGISGARSPALPMTILDGRIDAGGRFEHEVATGHSLWIYAVRGKIEVSDRDASLEIPEGQAMAIDAKAEPVALNLCATADSRFALVTGKPVRETFVQRGPFVMSTEAELAEVEANYRAGRLGGLSN